MSARVSVAPKGIFHVRKVDYSPETQRFLKELINESKLTMIQRKQLNESLKNGEPLPLPASRQSKTSSPQDGRDSTASRRAQSAGLLSRRRTKEQIVNSGAYSVETCSPSAPRVDYDSEKRRLQDLMAFGRHIKKKNAQEIKEQLKKQAERKSPETEKQEFMAQTVDEIRERMKFLEGMKKLGGSRDYEMVMKQEIAAKLRELEQRDEDFRKEMKEEYKRRAEMKALTAF